MKVIVKSSYEELSKYAANIIKEVIEKKPDANIGLATGSTPIGLYKELIKMYENREIDFENIKTFNLDEYIGLGIDDHQSYTYYMRENLFKHINIKKENTYIPNGKSQNLEEECIKYDETIKECGGIDIQLLGIGENGHIAFIEPNEELSLCTNVVPLTKSTIEVNSRFFDSIEDVPTTAISMGIGSIMKARKIILLACGKNKAKAINELINRKTLTTIVPASPLLLHQDVTLIVDEEALLLKRGE